MKLAQYRKISPALYAELKPLFEKHGFDVRHLRATVDERLGVVRLAYELIDKGHRAADGSETTPDAEYYREYCRQLGACTELRPDWLGKTFKLGGADYVLIGMKSKGKNKMIVRRPGETQVRVTTEEMVVLMFNAGVHPSGNVGSTFGAPRDAKTLDRIC